MCVVECIHSDLEAIYTIQNVGIINIGSKWSIYRSSVCSLKFKPYLI